MAAVEALAKESSVDDVVEGAFTLAGGRLYRESERLFVLAGIVGDEELIDTLEGFAGLAPEEEAPTLSLWFRQTGRPDGWAFGRAEWADGTIGAMAFPTSAVGRIVTAFRSSTVD